MTELQTVRLPWLGPVERCPWQLDPQNQAFRPLELAERKTCLLLERLLILDKSGVYKFATAPCFLFVVVVVVVVVFNVVVV